MRIAFTTKGTIGFVSLLSEDEVDKAASVAERLSQFFLEPDLKAAVIIIGAKLEDADKESDTLKTVLQTAPIPTAAAIPGNADNGMRELASSCLFQFTAPSEAGGSMEDAVAAAKTHLSTLTMRRTARVIRAVTASINNAGTLPLEDALLEETKLFCALARGNLENRGEADIS